MCLTVWWFYFLSALHDLSCFVGPSYTLKMKVSPLMRAVISRDVHFNSGLYIIQFTTTGAHPSGFNGSSSTTCSTYCTYLSLMFILNINLNPLTFPSWLLQRPLYSVSRSLALNCWLNERRTERVPVRCVAIESSCHCSFHCGLWTAVPASVGKGVFSHFIKCWINGSVRFQKNKYHARN